MAPFPLIIHEATSASESIPGDTAGSSGEAMELFKDFLVLLKTESPLCSELALKCSQSAY